MSRGFAAITDLISLARQNGFTHVAPVDLSAAVPLEEVRDMCTADRCGCFGKNWACPPHCGTVEQAARRLAQYHAGVLVQTTGALADPFDYDGMTALSRLHRRRFLNFARQARLVSPGCLPLSAGPCTLCARCTCPDKPCRRPRQRLSSMEAYGLFVSDVCVRSGLSYNYGPNTLTYTACVFYKKGLQNGII